MSTERDDLAEVIGEALGAEAGIHDTSWYEDCAIADNILAAGYRKPRTVTSAEELDTLSHESLILDAKNVCREGLTSVAGRNWWRSMGPARVLLSGEIELPATVLREGSAA